MIVTCRNCEARFQLDESRVPADGTRVRCSGCDDVFFVTPPAATADAPLLADAPDAEEAVESVPLAEDDFSDLAADPGNELESDEDLLDGGGWTLLDDEADDEAGSGEGDAVPEDSAGVGQSPEPSSSEPSSSEKVAIGAIALESVPAGGHRVHGAPTRESVRLRARLRTAGRALGWGLTVGLVLLGLVSALRETADSVATAEQTFVLGSLRADNLRGEWVDTMAGRTLLAVTGELRNPSNSTQVLGSPLMVSLEDAEGRQLDWPAAPVGLRIGESEIRELPTRALAAAQAQSARRLAGWKLAAGDSVAIQAIFPRPPTEAVRFVLTLGSPAEALPGE